MSRYEVVIGLEIHAQLKTKTKLFCACSTQFGDETNTNVCEVCLGMPGALPVLNKEAVNLAIKAGLALNHEIQERSIFERKNYFYPDLPKGYQISQFEEPICTNGSLKIQVDGVEKTIGITRIHMEEDAGKLLHQGAEGIAGATHSLVDLNRSGVALIEIVSEPDIRSAAEARAYVEALREILVYLDICDGNLEEGSMRVDANVSLREEGATEFGTRTETKNINSFRSLERAINYEIERQTVILNAGDEVIQQTRNYNDQTGKTTPLRSKEEAHDYRYFPEPDLKPLFVDQDQIESVRASMGELPARIRERYITEYELREKDAAILVADPSLNQFFVGLLDMGQGLDAKEIAKWVLGDITASIKARGLSYQSPGIEAAHIIELLSLLKSGDISGKMAKDILEKVFETQKSPKVLVKESGGAQISDASALDAFIDQVLNENPDVVEKVKGGKTKSADFLMGQVMRLSKGKAKPDLVRELLLKAIEAR